MSTRESLLAAVGFNDAANAGSTPEELVDAYRLTVIAARDAQIIAWLEKKAGEEGTSNKESRIRAAAIGRMADKLSRGAVRPPLSRGPNPVIELTDTEQQFLAFALELAADQMATRDGFDDNDQAALKSLRRLTGGAA